jgi:hypothetical protein
MAQASFQKRLRKFLIWRELKVPSLLYLLSFLLPHFLPLKTASQWGAKEKCRFVLVEFAKSRDFDPLVSTNWYKLEWADFTSSDVCLFLNLILF